MVIYDFGEEIITVIVGVDGQVPPLDILQDVELMVNDTVNKQSGFDIGRDSVTLTVVEHPSREQKEVIGPRTLYVVKFDINLGREEMDMEAVNGAHNTIVSKLNELGFNITGTATVWDGEMQK